VLLLPQTLLQPAVASEKRHEKRLGKTMRLELLCLEATKRLLLIGTVAAGDSEHAKTAQKDKKTLLDLTRVK
jgi:hypothetical protein